MVTITNLETQLVAKIAALDGSQTIKELMILKKSAENTAVDITALDARIDTYIAALSGASTDTDLLLSNKSAGLEVGASGGGGLIMPQFSTDKVGKVVIKSLSVRVADNLNAFWAAIDLDYSSQGYQSIKLTASPDTLEQTILDITGSGVLTQVLSPTMATSGVMTIRVTVDGETTVFTSETIPTNGRLCVGGFNGFDVDNTSGDGAGYGSGNDRSYAVSTTLSMQTPNQTLLIGNIGMPFKTSLKVTIQGSVNITGTSSKSNACACYSLAIPKGL